MTLSLISLTESQLVDLTSVELTALLLYDDALSGGVVTRSYSFGLAKIQSIKNPTFRFDYPQRRWGSNKQYFRF